MRCRRASSPRRAVTNTERHRDERHDPRADLAVRRTPLKTLIDLLEPAPPAEALGPHRRGLNLDSPHLEAFEEFLLLERHGAERQKWARRKLRQAWARASAPRPGLHLGAIPVASVVAWVQQFGTGRPSHRWELERLLGLHDPTPGWNAVRKRTADGRGEADLAEDGWVVFHRQYTLVRPWPGLPALPCSSLAARPARQEEALRSGGNFHKTWRDDLLAVRGMVLVPVAPIELTGLQDGWLRTFIDRRDLPGPWGRNRDVEERGVRFLPVSGDPPPGLQAFLDAVLSPRPERWFAGGLHNAARDAGWGDDALSDPRSFLRALRAERLSPRFHLLPGTLDPAQRVVGGPSDAEIEEEITRLGALIAASEWREDSIPLPAIIEEELDGALGRTTERADASAVPDRRSKYEAVPRAPRGWLEARRTGPELPWYVAPVRSRRRSRRDGPLTTRCQTTCFRVAGLKEQLRAWAGWRGLLVEASLLRLPRSDRERRRWGPPLLEVLVEHLPPGTPLLIVTEGELDGRVRERLLEAGASFSIAPPDPAWIDGWIGAHDPVAAG